MNYYIEGNPDKAEQIKAAFESKGYTTNGWNYNGKCGVYFTNEVDKTVYFTHIEPFVTLIKTHPDYKELELPVQSNFKVGDWVVFNNSHNSIYQISEIRDSYYMLTHTHGGSMSLPFSQENLIRLWTIQDAKDGDILHHSCTASNGTFIFKGVNESGKILCYCDYDSEDHFCLGEYHHIPHSPDSKFVHPATKEQRELLFAKMKEAGYEWDAYKKELRKIKPHYDIANFHAGMPVLVRDRDNHEWNYVLFSHCTKYSDCRFGAGSTIWHQCIPFNDDTKHLLGTTDMCDEQYINW